MLIDCNDKHAYILFRPTFTGSAAKAAPLFNKLRHTRLPGSRWEVSPGHTCGARESQVSKNALPLPATSDRQVRKPAHDGIHHSAIEVLAELANDPVSGVNNWNISLLHLGDRVHRDATTLRKHHVRNEKALR